jgi:hypothetical protein
MLTRHEVAIDASSQRRGARMRCNAAVGHQRMAVGRARVCLRAAACTPPARACSLPLPPLPPPPRHARWASPQLGSRV